VDGIRDTGLWYSSQLSLVTCLNDSYYDNNNIIIYDAQKSWNHEAECASKPSVIKKFAALGDSFAHLSSRRASCLYNWTVLNALSPLLNVLYVIVGFLTVGCTLSLAKRQ